MTTREFYVDVLNLIAVCALDEPADCVDLTALGAKAKELLEKLDASNAKRKSAESKEKREVRDRVERVRDSLTDTPVTADTVAESLGITVGQARAALTMLVRDGIAAKTEVKVDKARRVAYSVNA